MSYLILEFAILSYIISRFCILKTKWTNDRFS